MAGVKVTGEVVQGAGVQIADDGTLSATVSSPSFDALFGSTPGAFIYRGAASWTALSPGAVGQLLQSGGANGTPSWLSPSGMLDAFGNTQGDILYRGASSWSAVTPSAMLDFAFGSTQGDILYRGASAWAVLSPTATYSVLSNQAAANGPLWLSPSGMLDGAFSATQGAILYRGAAAWAALAPGTAGQVLQSGGASANPAWATLSNTVYRGYVDGLAVTAVAAATSFSVAAGSCADSTNAVLITLAALSKTTAAWSAGNNGGALDTGAIAANTWYHVHAISHSDGSSPDVLMSLSATAPTLPTGYTLFRRIRSLKTNGSSQFTGSKQVGGWVYWGTSITEVNSAAVTSGSDVTVTLAGAPPGVRVRPLLRVAVACNTSNSAGIAVRSPDMMGSESAPDANTGSADAGIVISGGTIVRVGAPTLPVFTNTSGQIVYNAYFNSGGTGTASIRNYGYFDLRGANN